jgi:two-component system cell cycle response regulator
MTPSGSGARILVVEDTPHSLQLMQYILQAHGHTVVAAVTGEEAVQFAQESCPDLVVMDLQLPGIDGYQALAALRGTPSLAAVPVVAVTSFAMVGDRDRALGAGFDHYMTKPIDPETFAAEIGACLPENRRGSPPVPDEDPEDHDGGPVEPGTTGRYTVDVLTLDDSPINQTLLRSVLEPHGYRVRTAFTVEEAIAAVEAERPDLVLSDIHVGRQSGTELLSYLRSVPSFAVLPFAFLTSTADWHHPLLEGGTAPVISRPIEPAALLEKVGALLPGELGH